MLNKYPTWKYILLVVIIGLGFLYAIPNLFVEDPAIEISPANSSTHVDAALNTQIETTLKNAKISYKKIEILPNGLLVRFTSTNTQLQAKDILENSLATDANDPNQNNKQYTVALNLASSTPRWLEAMGAKPMKLGLDLRGGVHFLLEVDMSGVLERRMQALVKSMTQIFREENLRYVNLVVRNKTNPVFQFSDANARDRAAQIVMRKFPELLAEKQQNGLQSMLSVNFSLAAINEVRQETIEQTMTTLRNRVNELGVAEAVVQQQGANRIAVDLPGIQDAAHAKQILGGTATLAFYLVDTEHDPVLAMNGVAPVGSRLYQYLGQPILLKNQVVLSGEDIVSARTGMDDAGLPAVHITISGANANLFSRITRDNVGKPLAIVYIETKTETKNVNGKPVKVRQKIERVISAPRIQTALGNNFQITGLESQEAKDLSLLLRAGSLPAAIDIAEERTVGPSLGLENIKRGLHSLIVGMALIIIFMAIYYRAFGLIADLALLLNLVLIVAILSIMGATMTLPGIASIVLTVGMAVDSNVLIFERIREELRNGATPQMSIHAGYDRAFATIVDANVTTLIVAVILFGIGSGAVRGFAVPLIIGLLTSMVTAITFTRAIVNFVYGGRSIKKISIGI